MRRETVVIVEPYSSGNMLAPAFRQGGFSPCAVTLSGLSVPNSATLRLADFDEHIAYDGGELGPLVDRLQELEPVAVVPGAHTGVKLGDELAAVLTPNLANAPDVGAARHHKGDMIAAVAAAGLPTIRSLCTSDVDDALTWVTRERLSGRDLVVKPVDSAGTDSVRFVPGGYDLRAVVTELLCSESRYGSPLSEVLVQEHVRGVEYAVDTFSYEGRHTINDIVQYHKVSSRRHIALYSSMEILPMDALGNDAIIDYVRGALDALGITFGAAHTEVMVTETGPLLMEVNARLAGNGHPWTCELATGDNSVDRMVRYLTGDRTIPDDYPFQLTTRVIFFTVRSAGVVSGLSRLDAIMDLPSCYNLQVNVEDGDHVPETADLFDAQRLGMVVLAHSDPAQVAADHREVRRIAAEAGRPGGFTIDPNQGDREW
ncbi:ATP-grasp domain-containing protein [Streptomyces sp. NPDC045470]|uniref:ATP-grasp domain-containing protein n=1 Tax=Streptomyces sp. NPDC045470 TaxID=3155469 RepID=UPI0033FC1778